MDKDMLLPGTIKTSMKTSFLDKPVKTRLTIIILLLGSILFVLCLPSLVRWSDDYRRQVRKRETTEIKKQLFGDSTGWYARKDAERLKAEREHSEQIVTEILKARENDKEERELNDCRIYAIKRDLEQKRIDRMTPRETPEQLENFNH